MDPAVGTLRSIWVNNRFTKYELKEKKKKATQIRILGLDAMEKRKSGFKGREIKNKEYED